MCLCAGDACSYFSADCRNRPSRQLPLTHVRKKSTLKTVEGMESTVIGMSPMKQRSFFAVIFLAVVSVFLFSGQQTRPVVQPRQPQQRPPVQQQVTPPRPPTVSAQPTPLAKPPAAEMPPLFWLPEDIQFPEAPPGASRTITLFGDPKAEGLYVTRTLIPKGAQTIPHSHPESRTVTVVSGVCYYGRGDEFNGDRTIAFPPGSFFTEPAGTPHFIWAKDSDVTVQTTAIGPSGTQIVPAKQPAAASGRP